MHSDIIRLVLAAAAFTPLSDPARSHAPTALAAAGDAVLTWNENAGKAATAACIALLTNPLHESRIYAIIHIAIHDALNAIERHSRPYAFDGPRQPGASPDTAVAAAARTVLVALISQLPSELTPASCIATGMASAEADYTAALGLIPDGPAQTQGIALGEAAARAIFAQRATDGASVGPFLNFACPVDTKPGRYQCLPGTPFTAFEVWADVTLFVLKDSSQFRPGPPYRVKSDKYAADFNEVKSPGGDGIITPSRRTADQTEIALFWWENSPLKWNRIARTIATGQSLDLWANARLFGLLNVPLADGYIAMVATKSHYNFWRPITAIRNGDTDGNPDTTGDPNWTPLRPTPPDRDYVSGHSTEGAQVQRCSSSSPALIEFTSRTVARRCLPVAPAAIRHQCCARIPRSPRRQPKTRFRASSLGSTSAKRSRKGLNTAEKLATVPQICTSALSTEVVAFH